MSKLIFIIIYIGTFESTHHIIPISIPVFDEATDFSILPLQTNKERRYYFKHNNFIHSGIVKSKIDISRMYHDVRGQTDIKLYVMFGVLECAESSVPQLVRIS